MTLKTVQTFTRIMIGCTVGIVLTFGLSIWTAVRQHKVEYAPPSLPMPATAR